MGMHVDARKVVKGVPTDCGDVIRILTRNSTGSHACTVEGGYIDDWIISVHI